ncbi:hypothetical protein RR48_10836 [Papilio machaon]|uniref:Uncharacterized protein n=1 Tax=Papilio machaon TaxID=76193 RepID=A0A194R7M8_PAPMA|nr:hypothetical protein RR48_10836 [Papilio machaon]
MTIKTLGAFCLAENVGQGFLGQGWLQVVRCGRAAGRRCGRSAERALAYVLAAAASALQPALAPIELKKRLEEIRLLESRKSARLADVDTDFARLADMAGDRRRASANIEVPTHHMQGSRKRGPSSSCDQGYGERDDQMNECNAALVLMSLSCSPNSPRPSAWGGRSSVSPGASSSSGSSWRSGTPSPPPVSSSFSDEGIAMDYEELHPRKKRGNDFSDILVNYDPIRCFVRLACKAPVVTGYKITGNGIPDHFSAVITPTSVGDYPQGTGHYTLSLQQGYIGMVRVSSRSRWVGGSSEYRAGVGDLATCDPCSEPVPLHYLRVHAQRPRPPLTLPPPPPSVAVFVASRRTRTSNPNALYNPHFICLAISSFSFNLRPLYIEIETITSLTRYVFA